MNTPADAAGPRSNNPAHEATLRAKQMSRRQIAVRRVRGRSLLVALLILLVALSLPLVGIAQRLSPAQARHLAARWPPPIKPVFAHPLPGEGMWKRTGPLVNGRPPVLVTTFRTELDNPGIVAYVAWFDHTRTALAYYPGRYEPPERSGAGADDGPLRPALAAARHLQRWLHLRRRSQRLDRQRTRERAAHGRQRDTGRLQERSRRDREVERRPERRPERRVGTPEPRSDRLERTPQPRAEHGPEQLQWGYTLGGVARVWRTGVGIDRRGNLIFVAADDQTVISLAQILQHVGAVRAMEFDINPEWHTLITYTHHHGLVPTLIEPQPMQSPNRYLVPDNRDFFAVYRRLPGPVTVPFR